MPNNAYNLYRTTAVQTASPGKLLLMLYDGLILSLKQAKEAIGAQKPAEAHRYLVKSQDIIDELIVTLNMDYEISTNLYQLYDFWKYQLIQANMKKDAALIDTVLPMVVELRGTWSAVVESTRGEMAAK